MGWMVPVVFAAAQKQQHEKLLAELIGKDKEDKYEFKILRGYPGTFRNPERFQAILEEERRSRWEMVIKLDNESIILRRPRRAQAYDTMSGSETDPYRTQIGSRAAAKLYVFFGLLLLGGVVAFWFTKNAATADGAGVPTVVVAIAVGILLFLVLALKRNR